MLIYESLARLFKSYTVTEQLSDSLSCEEILEDELYLTDNQKKWLESFLYLWRWYEKKRYLDLDIETDFYYLEETKKGEWINSKELTADLGRYCAVPHSDTTKIIGYHYSDHSYIELASNGLFYVLIANSDKEFNNLSDAEDYLWENHASFNVL